MEKAPELQELAQKGENTLPLASFLHCPNPAHGRADIKHSTLLLGVLVTVPDLGLTQLGPTPCDIL